MSVKAESVCMCCVLCVLIMCIHYRCAIDCVVCYQILTLPVILYNRNYGRHIYMTPLEIDRYF